MAWDNHSDDRHVGLRHRPFQELLFTNLSGSLRIVGGTKLPGNTVIAI
jgi:hypothetical protein